MLLLYYVIRIASLLPSLLPEPRHAYVLGQALPFIEHTSAEVLRGSEKSSGKTTVLHL